MGRFVVAGAGAVGASIALHLARRGVRDVVLADVGTVASGATGKAMGGIRQQFTTPAEIRLAQLGARFFAAELGPPLFEAVGYLFLATTEEGAAELRRRIAVQRSHGVPVEETDPGRVAGLAVHDVHAAAVCLEDGVADPVAVTRELIRRAAALGVEVREHTDALTLPYETLVLACGAASADVARRVGVDLPVRPLCRQLAEIGPVPRLPRDLPMTIELETGFHFRRAGENLRLAMGEPTPRWTDEAAVDEELVADWRRRAAARYPAAAGAELVRSWAGLYDMTPDAHPILDRPRDDLYVACGFSGHGFMISPAVGAAVAADLVGDEPPIDLAPYRLGRFAGGAAFPETLIL